jgi:acetyl-CoA synthetase (ADP-forming)
MENESKDLIAQYGIPVGEYKVVRSEDKAKSFSNKINYPVVAKLMSPDIIHKTEAGIVKLNLKSEEEVVKAYREIIDNAKKYNANAKIQGINIQEMIKGGVVEIIVGALRDVNFGPIIMFGLGGIFIEIFKDVAYRVCPISKWEAEKMIKEIKAFPLLDGYRNTPKGDINAIVDIIRTCCEIMQENPEIEEIDLNPIIVFERGKGLSAVDARIIITEEKHHD